MGKFRIFRRTDTFLTLKYVSLRKSLLFLMPCLTKYTNNNEIKNLFQPTPCVYVLLIILYPQSVFMCSVLFSAHTVYLYVVC